MLHVGSIRQTVQIEAILDKPCIRTGDRATVAFKFIKHAEYIRVGERSESLPPLLSERVESDFFLPVRSIIPIGQDQRSGHYHQVA